MSVTQALDDHFGPRLSALLYSWTKLTLVPTPRCREDIHLEVRPLTEEDDAEGYQGHKPQTASSFGMVKGECAGGGWRRPPESRSALQDEGNAESVVAVAV